ncbi:MAG: ATP-dependent helicase [Lachnospiraceae bacterium]|nr:ATP-dependent helicase [Lachnospiraceae bacterium]
MKSKFNEAQISAINHFKGPALVLAGPGSGKTTVITHRTKKLIEEYGVNPSNILVITFTKAAATQMQDRFTRLMDGKYYPVSFGTFHAVYFKILKYAYNYSADNILREEKKIEYIKEIIGKLRLEIDDINDFVREVTGEISLVKGEMLDLNNYYSKSCPDESFRKLYKMYNDRLVRENVVDFDDMLVMCYELLVKRPDILKMWQEKYQYILIDEFQDICRVQYEVIKLLAKPQDNIFIVGDDDQSIYRFRGAKPEIMFQFKKDYENVEQICLSTNYRSTNEIIQSAMKLINNNEKRFFKAIKGTDKLGEKVEIATLKNDKEEAMYILRLIDRYLKLGYEYNDIAVLYRTNTNPRQLVDKLLEFNLPFRMKDVIPNIYEHWIARDILTYIRIALGSRKRADFLQIINRPKRYIARDAFYEEEVSFWNLKEYYSDKVYVIERIDRLKYDLQWIERMSPYEAINYIRHGIGYDEYVLEYANYRKMRPEELYEILDELQEMASEYKSYDKWFEHIVEYGEELKRQNAEKVNAKDGVELSTMHSSKGLEYRVVIILGANEGIAPYKKAMLKEDIEEERRLFYVGMTRAKERLHILSVKERYGKDTDVSRFVSEIKVVEKKTDKYVSK